MPDQLTNIDSVSQVPDASSDTGVSSSSAAPEVMQSSRVGLWKAIILGGMGLLYMIYLFWCLFLVATLPSITAPESLQLIGIASCILGALVFLGIGVALFSRIAHTSAGMRTRQMALIKLGLAVIPGILLSAATPFFIIGEPSLNVQIVSPSNQDEIVAPLPMTFSVEHLLEPLAARGFTPVQYRWDMDGDRKSDQESLEPIATRTFERSGIYTVNVSLISAGNEAKTASINFIIRDAVFSIAPNPPVVDRPVVFSVAHLIEDPKQVQSVAWDFNGDGSVDEESTALQTSFTFLNIGRVQISTTVTLSNGTQTVYNRAITIENPKPLPFPATVDSLPQNLIGTAPFSALFTVNTDEPIHSVLWNFGDGERGEGERVLHTFERIGVYNVQAAIRSMTGAIASVFKIVRVVELLNLPDLKIEGTPVLTNNAITGEAPLTLNLEASTANQFVEFSWEAPDATDIGLNTSSQLQAIYRRPGTYTVTLVAKDLQNKVLRKPITVTVIPPTSLITIRMAEETGIAPFTARFDASESTIPGEDITGFVWDFGDKSQKEVGGAVTQHVYRTPGTYTVTLTAQTASGQQESATKNVTVRAPTIQARIFASRLSGSAPLTVEFDGSGSSGTAVSYLWDFGDGSQTDGPRALHTFTQPGVYTVQLTVSDQTGASTSTSTTITVQ